MQAFYTYIYYFADVIYLNLPWDASNLHQHFVTAHPTPTQYFGLIVTAQPNLTWYFVTAQLTPTRYFVTAQLTQLDILPQPN